MPTWLGILCLILLLCDNAEWVVLILLIHLW